MFHKTKITLKPLSSQSIPIKKVYCENRNIVLSSKCVFNHIPIPDFSFFKVNIQDVRSHHGIV